jgi:hypothetical protein
MPIKFRDCRVRNEDCLRPWYIDKRFMKKAVVRREGSKLKQKNPPFHVDLESIL